MNMTVIDKNTGMELEQAETNYWREFFESTPDYLRNKIGVNYKMINGAFAGAVSQVDILAFNRVLGFGLESEVEGVQIQSIINFYRNAAVKRFFLPVSPFAETIVTESLLEENGFTYYNNWAKFFKKLSEPLPLLASNVRVVKAEPRMSKTFDSIIQSSFQWEGNAGHLFSTTMGRPGWKHYFANIGDQPIACAGMYFNNGYASLAIAGTLPDYRGAGAQSALITARLNDALENGCKYAVVETAEDKPDKPSASNRNIKRLGFELAYLRKNYIFCIGI